MNPLHYLLILRAHWKVALAVFLLSVATGTGITLTMPKRYISSTAVVFDAKPDPIVGMLLPGGPGYVATQVEIIKSDRVALKVVRNLGLDKSPSVKQQWLEATDGKGQLDIWFAEVLQRGTAVNPSSGSNILTISYISGDPAFAALVANAFAQAYIDASIELKVDPARQYSRWFSEQGKILRENLEKAQTRLSEFQQEKGIVAREEQLDTETTRLNALASELSSVQNQMVDIESKRRSGSDTLPEVMSNPVVANLRNEIVRQEAKLQEAAGNLGKSHPQYLRMESEIASLKQQLEAESRRVASGFSASRAVGRDREAELRAAIALQKRKVLELKNGRDQLAVLQRDVDAAQKAYEAVTQRYNQTSLESQATQSNVSVLTPAVEPLEPASPNVKRNMLLTLLAGLVAGCGAAYLLELMDRRIRSADDLADMLQLPVLAVIKRPQQPRLLSFLRRPALPAPR